MPEPRAGESEVDFVARCIPVVIEDGTAEDGSQANAICHSMYQDAQKAVNGNALKAVGQDDDTLTVANYIILFGGRDLEGLASDRVNGDGSKGERFAPTVEVESAYTKAGVLYVDWEHGRGKMVDGADAPGRDDVLGTVNWKTAKRDDRGIWVERALNRRSKYMEYLEALIAEGLIGTSSEPVQDGVEIKASGEIVRWPLHRDALTVTPMEPRMLSDNALAALKALAEAYPDVPSLAKAVGDAPTREPEAAPEADPIEGPAASASAPAEPEDTHNHPAEAKGSTEGKPMSEKEKTTEEQAPEPAPVAPVDYEALGTAFGEAVKTAVTEAVETVDARWAERTKREKKPDKSGGFYIVADQADRALEGDPYTGIGEFLMDVAQVGGHGIVPDRLKPLKSSDPLTENGFDMVKALGPDYIGSLTAAASHSKAWKAPTGLGETVPSAGGFLVGTDRAPGLLARVYEIGSLLSRVSMVGVSANSNGMTFNAEDETSRATGSRRGGIRAYWAAEAAEKTASYPKFRQMELKLYKVIGLVYATDELLQDASALESWISQNLPEELRFTVEDAILNGTGAGQPLGILNSGSLVSVAKETGQAAATLVSENIMKMWARRWVPARDYVWLVNQDCGPQLWSMSLPVGTGGVALYQPPGGLSQTPYATLMGRPVIEVEYAQTLGTQGDILLASLNEYQMIEKGGIQSASSIHVRFVYDETCFRFVYRIDGQPKWDAALTPFHGTNTVSPFVALDTRS